MALADNDGEGRDLWKEKSIHKGGIWKRQINGVWWCLLSPSEEFRKVMERFAIEPRFWPFTIENAFPAALRFEARAEGAYTLAKVPQVDFFRDQGLVDRIAETTANLPEDDPALLYLLRPTTEAKDAFAAWITSPARLTPDNYASFGTILTRLKDVIA
jgi:hypothetical protein